MTEPGTPVVSFLVILGDNVAYLSECLQSIHAQSFVDWEILLLDVGQHPEVSELAQLCCREEPRIRHLLLPATNTEPDSLNHGVRQSRGDLIWIVSTSARLSNNQALQDYVTQFMLHPKLGTIFCRAQAMDEHSQPYERYWPSKKNSNMPYTPTLYPGNEFFRQLLKGNFIPDSASVIRKTCIERADGFQHQLLGNSLWQNALRCCLDWDVYFDPIPNILARALKLEKDAKVIPNAGGTENQVLSYLLLEEYLKERCYPKQLRHQVQFTRLQFMRRQGLKMSFPERIIRFYRVISESALIKNPLAD